MPGKMVATNPAEIAVFDRFTKRYEVGQSDIVRSIEQRVCGCDYGATSWTTADEARRICAMLNLGSGQRLLDLGSGTGWPGLFIASETNCDVVLTDLPFGAVKAAMRRAESDNLHDRCCVAVADGTSLPFDGPMFDAVTHSDVLCCLADKLGVLRSCRNVVRENGKMIFSVILISPGVDAKGEELAKAGGPPFIETDAPYHDLLAQAGWSVTGHIDLTPEYRTTVANMLGQLEEHAAELDEVYGVQDASDERRRRRAMLDALKHGYVRRELFEVGPTIS